MKRKKINIISKSIDKKGSNSISANIYISRQQIIKEGAKDFAIRFESVMRELANG